MGWHQEENLPEEGKERSVPGAHEPWQSHPSLAFPGALANQTGMAGEPQVTGAGRAEQSNAPHHVTQGCGQLLFKKAAWDTGERVWGRNPGATFLLSFWQTLLE